MKECRFCGEPIAKTQRHCTRCRQHTERKLKHCPCLMKIHGTPDLDTRIAALRMSQMGLARHWIATELHLSTWTVTRILHGKANSILRS